MRLNGRQKDLRDISWSSAENWVLLRLASRAPRVLERRTLVDGIKHRIVPIPILEFDGNLGALNIASCLEFDNR